MRKLEALEPARPVVLGAVIQDGTPLPQIASVLSLQVAPLDIIVQKSANRVFRSSLALGRARNRTDDHDVETEVSLPVPPAWRRLAEQPP